MKTILLFIILCTTTAYAQNNKNIDSLICKKWRIESNAIGGVVYPADSSEDKTIFYLDHTAENIQSGHSKFSTWSYDAYKNTLMLRDKISKEETILSIIQITDIRLVVSYAFCDAPLTVYLKVVK
ncbi:MAG: hypothetical protein JWO58_2967 [Chitinophagaceae bacterium]|nr:hypothetical protein [Chitinophagaceae bacterium]